MEGKEKDKGDEPKIKNTGFQRGEKWNTQNLKK
jgi:hypothetical protein